LHTTGIHHNPNSFFVCHILSAAFERALHWEAYSSHHITQLT
jgi:hypothetical protein